MMLGLLVHVLAGNFHGKVPKEGLKCNVDSVSKLGKNYYSQIFLEEWKYKIKEKETKALVKDDLKSSFDNDFTKKILKKTLNNL